MSIGEICNRDVVFTLRSSSVQAAAQLMRQYHVGCLVVVEDQTEPPIPVGLVTDRDLVIELLAQDADTEQVSIGDVMSSDMQSVREDEGVWDVIRRMRSNGVRRMPVLASGGGLVGIFTMDDAIDLLADELSDLASLVTRERQREQESRTRV